MIKYTSIRKFMRDLTRELDSLDPETIRYAVSSSEDHLNMMVEEILEDGRGIRRRNAIQMAVQSFGYPSEIAVVYRSEFLSDM